MKKCPYCAEEIQDAAIVCRYCGKDLVQSQRGPIPQIETPKKKSKSWKIPLIILGVCTILGICIILFLLEDGLPPENWTQEMS